MYIDYKLRGEQKEGFVNRSMKIISEVHPIVGAFVYVILFPIVVILSPFIGVALLLAGLLAGGKCRIVYKCQQCSKILGSPFAHWNKAFELLALKETCRNCGQVNQVTLRYEIREQAKSYRGARNASERVGPLARLYQLTRIVIEYRIHRILLNSISIPSQSPITKPPLESKDMDFYAELTRSISKSLLQVGGTHGTQDDLLADREMEMKRRTNEILHASALRVDTMESAVSNIIREFQGALAAWDKFVESNGEEAKES